MVKLTEGMDTHRWAGKNLFSVKANCLTNGWVRVPINTQRTGTHSTFPFSFHNRLPMGTRRFLPGGVAFLARLSDT